VKGVLAESIIVFLFNSLSIWARDLVGFRVVFYAFNGSMHKMHPFIMHCLQLQYVPVGG
jgi:hypothetical protein